ncbi:MAG: NAD-dependent epimerase/dehydratase family protein [Acinetobacter sp.]
MILLTGATGFVGKAVLHRLLLQSKFDIRTYGRRTPSGLHHNSQLSVTHVVGDLSDTTDYSSVLNDVDVVIHCAAQAHINKNITNGQEELNRINCNATLQLARQSIQAGVRRFIFISSIGVNGLATFDTPFTLKSKEAPHNAYSKSKFDAEIGLKKIAVDTEMGIVIVRPTLVYGPNAPGNFGMLTRLIRTLSILPFGLANNRRDFIAVQNLADLLVTCATHPSAPGHTFLASESETVSSKQFTNAIAKAMGKKVIQLPIPVSLMRVVGKLTGKSAMIEQLFGNLEVDSSNIQQVLGWTPPFTMDQAMAQLNNSGKYSYDPSI